MHGSTAYLAVTIFVVVLISCAQTATSHHK